MFTMSMYLFMLGLCLVGMATAGTLPIRVLSHNIRYATTSPFKGEEFWNVRAPRLVSELRYNTLYNDEAFLCLQEVLDNQLQDILDGLNSNSDEWAYIGVGRDDGVKAGEYSPILYRPRVWNLQDFRTIWLSETPDRPSKGWDAASIRILTIGEFTHREQGSRITVMSTHLDDQGSQSRYESAKIIAQKVQASLSPVFLAGDFNSEPGEEAYVLLSSSGSPVYDLRGVLPKDKQYGHNNTFTGFGYEDEPEKRIDFLFLSKGKDWQARGYSVLESRFDDGVYDSDHRAVVGDVLLDSNVDRLMRTKPQKG